MNDNFDQNHKLANASSFGSALTNARKQKGIASGRLAIQAGTYPSLLSNIEKGSVVPSIASAMRLVYSLDLDVVNFFKDLAISQNLFAPSSHTNHSHDLEKMFLENARLKLENKDLSTTKSLFGLLFREFRVMHKVTQQKVSEFTSYSIRNIQKVERGEQDPNVMTALSMVCAVAQRAEVNIDMFFAFYQSQNKL